MRSPHVPSPGGDDGDLRMVAEGHSGGCVPGPSCQEMGDDAGALHGPLWDEKSGWGSSEGCPFPTLGQGVGAEQGGGPAPCDL